MYLPPLSHHGSQPSLELAHDGTGTRRRLVRGAASSANPEFPTRRSRLSPRRNRATTLLRQRSSRLAEELACGTDLRRRCSPARQRSSHPRQSSPAAAARSKLARKGGEKGDGEGGDADVGGCICQMHRGRGKEKRKRTGIFITSDKWVIFEFKSNRKQGRRCFHFYTRGKAAFGLKQLVLFTRFVGLLALESKSHSKPKAQPNTSLAVGAANVQRQ